MPQTFSNQASSVRLSLALHGEDFEKLIQTQGINAAVNVANGSIARLSNVNITTHNGAANLYSFGTGSVAYVDNA
jgi:hypothetical protein